MTHISPVDLNVSLASIGAANGAQVQNALKIKAKAKQAAQSFEANFLGNMFQQMFTGIDGDGPFGGQGALKVWRSFMTDEIAKSFAKAGGIGISPMVYNQLLKEQGLQG